MINPYFMTAEPTGKRYRLKHPTMNVPANQLRKVKSQQRSRHNLDKAFGFTRPQLRIPVAVFPAVNRPFPVVSRSFPTATGTFPRVMPKGKKERRNTRKCFWDLEQS